MAIHLFYAVAAGNVLNKSNVPYVILISEHDNGPGIRGLQQAPDNLVKLSRLGLPGDLQGLGNAYAT